MPRKPNPVTIPHPPQVNDQAVRESMDAADKLSQQLARIDERYGDGKPYERRRLVLECRGIVSLTGEALFELGKRLVLLKEHEPHGEFLDALKEIGVESRFAQKAMQAAVKFTLPKAPSTALFAGLGQGKLLELLVLDDEQVEELGDGGTVAGLSLDQVARMSTRELREEVRRLKAEKERDDEVHQRVLKQKNDKIDELDARISRRDASLPAERYQSLAEELWQAAVDVGGPLLRLEQVLAAVGELEAVENIPESLDLARGQTLAFLVQAIVDMQSRHRISADLSERVTPPWMKAAA